MRILAAYFAALVIAPIALVGCGEPFADMSASEQNDANTATLCEAAADLGAHPESC